MSLAETVDALEDRAAVTLDGRRPQRPRKSGSRKGHGGTPTLPWTAHDRALIDAARNRKAVLVEMAIETAYAKEGSFTGIPLEVDTYSVKFLLTPGKIREVWVSKPHIVSTETLV